jgi:hypothetical protein
MLGATLGIVVQNNDPQKRGRVKVFIPHLSLNVLEGWDDLNEEKTFERLSDPKIKDVIDKIKNQLPWANCAAPIFGEVGNHIYGSLAKESTFGDSGDRNSDKPAKSVEDSPPEDAFQNKYEHTSYNNSAKGLFSVPRVGSRVWVFFENGNPNRPVYFATAYNKEDWEKISENNYPNDLENASPDAETNNTEYENKVVISQRGGTIEIVNSDKNESLQISHYNGGFKIWANGGTKEYVEGEDKKLVKSNSQLHIGGNMDVRINGNANLIIDGNFTANVGGTYNVTSGGNMSFTAPRIDLN